MADPFISERVQTDKIAGLLMALILVAGACQKHSSPAPAGRSYRLGFMSSAPRPDINLYLQSLSIWPLHADATIISTEVPWDSLINGEDPATYVVDNYVGLVNYCRSLNLKLWVYIDPANGLNRASDSDPLVARGKSIAQTGVQQIYRRFVVVIMQELGISSYPYLGGYAAPGDIPLNYYSQLVAGHPLPVFVSEGGGRAARLSRRRIFNSKVNCWRRPMPLAFFSSLLPISNFQDGRPLTPQG